MDHKEKREAEQNKGQVESLSPEKQTETHVTEKTPHAEKQDGQSDVSSEASTMKNGDNESTNQNTTAETAQQAEELKESKKIELHAEFCSFLELRDAIEKYQREKSVQLIVKDSKLLKAESTRKVIPKVYHLVNQELMYHSITYCCKCHGELRQKPGTRVKNVGAKRLSCPMYFRLKLTSDLQRLVLFDIDETHNHGIDPTTCQMTPRQQVYTLSRLRQGKRELDSGDTTPTTQSAEDVASLVASAIKDVSSISSSSYEPSSKRVKVEPAHDDTNPEEEVEETASNHPESPLDSESSFSDSEDEELSIRRQLLPFPVRLIGSAVQSSPELLAASRQLIELQKSKLELERQKLLLQTKNLELCNAKLELEVKKMERTLAAEVAESEHAQDTTIYLQAS